MRSSTSARGEPAATKCGVRVAWSRAASSRLAALEEGPAQVAVGEQAGEAAVVVDEQAHEVAAAVDDLEGVADRRGGRRARRAQVSRRHSSSSRSSTGPLPARLACRRAGRRSAWPAGRAPLSERYRGWRRWPYPCRRGWRRAPRAPATRGLSAVRSAASTASRPSAACTTLSPRSRPRWRSPMSTAGTCSVAASMTPELELPTTTSAAARTRGVVPARGRRRVAAAARARRGRSSAARISSRPSSMPGWVATTVPHAASAASAASRAHCPTGRARLGGRRVVGEEARAAAPRSRRAARPSASASGSATQARAGRGRAPRSRGPGRPARRAGAPGPRRPRTRRSAGRRAW